VSNYLKANYRLASVSERGQLVPVGSVPESTIKQKLHGLVTVVDDRNLNAIGAKIGRGNPLSVTWLERQVKGKTRVLPKLKGNLRIFFEKRARIPAHLNI